MLADGPWTIGRFALEPPDVVAAAKWIAFARQLRAKATEDLDAIRAEIDDAAWSQNAGDAARKGRVQSKIAAARRQLGEAYKQRREVRALLLLDEEPNGKP